MANSCAGPSRSARSGRFQQLHLDGLIAPFWERDVVEMARLSLMEDGHENQIYELTGEQFISARGQVHTLAVLCQRRIACDELNVETALVNLTATGHPDWIVDSLRLKWTGLAAGEADHRTGTFRELTGKAPEGNASWCAAHRSDFG